MHRIVALIALTLAVAAIVRASAPPAQTPQTQLARELPGNGDGDGSET
jgi:hypothetical protein